MNLKSLTFPLIFLGTLAIINCNDAKASFIKEVSTLEAQNSLDLKVYAGYGLTISFQKTGEKIIQAWLADPSRIVFSTNAKDCSKSDKGSCLAEANVLFLRQIKEINFPNLTKSSDGGTQLVILTSGREGQKQYLFRILPVTGTPEYTSVVLSPLPDSTPHKKYQDAQQPLLPASQNSATYSTEPLPTTFLNFGNSP